METTDKKSVQQLVDILWQKEVKHIVISPGSRNAPLILGFNSHPKYECLSVPDERSAAFIALGISDETKSPVVLVCTSGSALLNYYPAIAEAFYRKIPLIVLSADRPEYLIDQGDGQTIRQTNVFANHILYSSQLEETDNSTQNEYIINQALNQAISSGGPIHLNIPFEEPLYNKVEFELGNSAITFPTNNILPLSDSQIQEYATIWNNSKKIIILAGQIDNTERIIDVLEKLNSRALVLSETTSNLYMENSIQSIDRLISPFNEQEEMNFQPDLLITFGGNVVSKRIKAYLRTHTPKHHIHIEICENAPDTYQCLTHHCKVPEYHFFEQLEKHIDLKDNGWVQKWLNIDQRRHQHQQEYLNSVSFSDIKVMQTVRDLLPQNSILHLANSTPVRYAQLFDWNKGVTFKSNRGTSGIDGIVSTAIGNAIATEKQVFLIVGDISFFYDTNAWWHRHIPKNLKVLVVNNSGGGIFRFIDGPNSTGQLESYFETHQKNSVKHIALGFDVDYFCASNMDELKPQFKQLSDSNSSGILEVITPQTKNAEILKNYFKNIS